MVEHCFHNKQKKNMFVCPSCGCGSFEHAFNVHSNADGPVSGYRIKQCQSCMMGVTVPLNFEHSSERFYSQGVYSQSGGRGEQLVSPILSVLYDMRLREIRHWKKGPFRLLDAGCGKGRFVAHANTMPGIHAEGVETSRNQVMAARQKYGIRVTRGELWEADIENAAFDVVTGWHVLEHLDSPLRFVHEARRLLKPDGILALEVPNFSSLQSHIGRGDWFHLDVPRHVNHFTLTSLQYLLRAGGFNLVGKSTFSIELGFFGMLQSILNRMGYKPNGLFRWLKRTVQISPFEVVINMMTASAISVPSILLESLASSMGRGGVVRIFARPL